ncbi:MAG: phosphotransferase [Actinomycetota bacterium]|nr:phosphotransferase [Actinomycetota bacterium]
MACRGARLPTLGPCAGQSRPNAEGIFGESEDSAPECTSRPPPLRTDARAYREAGVLLRQLHESRPARMQQPSDLGRTSLRLERLLARKPGLFTPAEVSFVRSHANRINDLRLDKKVPCHGDYTSQNWLVDAFDTLRVIDFGASRRAIAASDFSQLFFGAWWRRPDLAAVFFEGYGRPLAEHELEFIRLRMATYAVQGIVFGHERGTHQHQDYGRARLADLMKGHQVHHRSPPSSSRTRP